MVLLVPCCSSICVQVLFYYFCTHYVHFINFIKRTTLFVIYICIFLRMLDSSFKEWPKDAWRQTLVECVTVLCMNPTERASPSSGDDFHVSCMWTIFLTVRAGGCLSQVEVSFNGLLVTHYFIIVKPRSMLWNCIIGWRFVSRVFNIDTICECFIFPIKMWLFIKDI